MSVADVEAALRPHGTTGMRRMIDNAVMPLPARPPAEPVGPYERWLDRVRARRVARGALRAAGVVAVYYD